MGSLVCTVVVLNYFEMRICFKFKILLLKIILNIILVIQQNGIEKLGNKS